MPTEVASDHYQKSVDFISSVVGSSELGYVYAFPDKKLYTPVTDPAAFIQRAWAGYQGDVGLYVHVPYCTPKPPPPEVKNLLMANNMPTDGRDHLCGYCNLYTTVAKEVPRDFTDAMLREIDLYRQLFAGRTLQATSLYFGGGSPSLLRLDDLQQITKAIESSFGRVKPSGEYNIECIPDTLDAEKLVALRYMGFNRVSIGVQSLDPTVLHYTGRNYDARLGYDMVKAAMAVGFDNVNADLIVGLPMATREIFLDDVRQIAGLSPHVVTLYQNMVRPITRFGRMEEKGFLPHAQPREIYEWTAIANQVLAEHGYNRINLTCWSKDGGRYQQGEDVYEGTPLLGFGPSARSYGPNAHYSTEYTVSTRLTHYAIKRWKDRVRAGHFPDIEGFELTPEVKLRRDAVLGLFSTSGVKRQILDPVFHLELKALIDLDMLVEEGGYLKYTERGKTYSGALARLFYGEEIKNRLNQYFHR